MEDLPLTGAGGKAIAHAGAGASTSAWSRPVRAGRPNGGGWPALGQVEVLLSWSGVLLRSASLLLRHLPMSTPTPGPSPIKGRGGRSGNAPSAAGVGRATLSHKGHDADGQTAGEGD
jgi:hypothetical protein